ncbi:MAG: CPBP family glutamic-type intramembrane protease [Alphaproteobacteria bacterium]|nr:CPBP family glutamic-type intramembrane protease [Alphaproteobacteria bacterium]
MSPYKNVYIFVLLTFLLSWPFMIYAFGFTDNLLSRYTFASLGMMMVTVSAILVRYYQEKKNFEDVCWNKGELKWYLVILAFFLIYYMTPYLLEYFLGDLEMHELTFNRTIVLISSLSISYIAAFGEEFGWRGYLQKRLMDSELNHLNVLTIIGIIWGIWHFPIALGPFLRELFMNNYSYELLRNALISCAQMIGASIGLSYIFGSFYLKFKSIYLNSFLHFTYIGIRDATFILFGATIFDVPIHFIPFVIVLAVTVRWLNTINKKDD